MFFHQQFFTIPQKTDQKNILTLTLNLTFEADISVEINNFIVTGMDNYAQHHLFLTISESFIKIKSHTYEEAGAHIRISFWHLLMSFKKPESEF